MPLNQLAMCFYSETVFCNIEFSDTCLLKAGESLVNVLEPIYFMPPRLKSSCTCLMRLSEPTCTIQCICPHEQCVGEIEPMCI